MGVPVRCERVGEWAPILSKFYVDMQRWSFALQMRILQSYTADAAFEGVSERSAMESRHVFAQMLHDDGCISPEEWQLYLDWYGSSGLDVESSCARPLHYVYVRAPVDVLMGRIARRNRACETTVTREYLSRVESYYEQFLHILQKQPRCTVTVVDGTQSPVAIADAVARAIGVGGGATPTPGSPLGHATAGR